MALLKIVFLSLFLSSCTASYSRAILKENLAEIGLQDKHEYQRMATWRLSPRANIALKLAESKGSDLPRTTQKLNSVLLEEFAQYFSSFSVASASHLEDMLFAAFHSGSEILVVTHLVGAKNNLNSRQELELGKMHYPERDWGRDELVIQFYIYETQTKKLLDLVTLKSHAAYFKSEDKVALDLIQASLKNYLHDLTTPNPS